MDKKVNLIVTLADISKLKLVFTLVDILKLKLVVPLAFPLETRNSLLKATTSGD